MVYGNNTINYQIHDKIFNKKIIINKIDNLYKHNVFPQNKTKNKITEILKNDDDFFKVHLLCQKETNIDEYNKRHNLLSTFNNLFKKFMKTKYNIELKSKHLCYTDISYMVGNNYIISFYVIVFQEFGIFRNMNNIFILMKEFNKILKNHNNKLFGDNFINLNIYNKKMIKNVIMSKHLFTYINNESINISIYNENIYKNDKIFHKHYFAKNLIGYYGSISNVLILDLKTKTLNDYFSKFKIDEKNDLTGI
jgi:hypothetical protein